MNTNHVDNWDPEFFKRSPLFVPLLPLLERYFQQTQWPSLAEYRAVFRQQNMDVMPVAQGVRPQSMDQLYESRIFLFGELQTRLHNWHDFFNALVWLSFPHTKQVLNTLHYHASLQRDQGSNRSPLENLVTLFDECGAILVSRRGDLLQMIRERQWRRLFVEHRAAFESDVRCVVFGHAIYEKALSPYVGMTTRTLLIESDMLLDADLNRLDDCVAELWLSDGITGKDDFSPLPILGIPDWFAANKVACFYDDKRYFRV